MAEKNPFARFLSHFPAGKVLFREGDAGEDMYIIQSGRVAIKKRTGANKDVTLAVLEKGDFFGEMAVLERMPRSATAEMAEARRPDRDLRRHLRRHDQVEPGNRLPHAPQVLDPSPRDGEADRDAREADCRVAGGNAHQHLDLPALGSRFPQPPPSEALAYFVSKASGNVFPVYKNEVLLGRFDSVTGTAPDVDLTNEDQARNISRRHARLVIKNGAFFMAEEIGTMNGTFVAGEKLDNNVLHPIKDGDELMLCRLALTFKGPQK